MSTDTDHKFDGIVDLRVRMMVAEKTRDKLIESLYKLNPGPQMSQIILDLTRIEELIHTYQEHHSRVQNNSEN